MAVRLKDLRLVWLPVIYSKKKKSCPLVPIQRQRCELLCLQHCAGFILLCFAALRPCVEWAQPSLLAAAAGAHIQGQAGHRIPREAGTAVFLTKCSCGCG